MGNLLIDPYKATELTYYAQNTKGCECFVLDKFFTSKESHETNNILYERRSSARKLAEFVAMNEENPVPIRHSMKVNNLQFELARTFEIKSFTKNQMDKMAGIHQTFANQKDRDQYRSDYVATEIEDMKSRVNNRLEQLACLGIVTGKQVITDSQQTVEYDYGFKAGEQLIALATKWSDPTSDPIADLRRLRSQMMDNCDLKPDTVLLGRNVAEVFLRNPKVKEALDTLNYRVGNVDLTQNNDSSTAELIAQMLGMKFYEYSQKFTNSLGTKEDFFPASGCVLLSGSSKGFVQHAGTIYRVDENGRMVQMAKQLWMYPITNEHKTKFSWTAESICVPMIHEPEAIISLSNVI